MGPACSSVLVYKLDLSLKVQYEKIASIQSKLPLPLQKADNTVYFFSFA
jgi:hypothetical protein